MSDKNFDYKGALAFETWLRLRREAKELEEMLEDNKEQQTSLLKDFPAIGTMKGMLRKEKKRKVPEKSDSNLEGTGNSATPPTEKSSPRTPRKTSKTSSTRELLTKKLATVEEKRRTSTTKDRRSPKDAGGEVFHPTSSTAPPDTMELSDKH